MKRSQLTEKELRDRAAFVAAATRAGWDPTDWELRFALDVSLEPEARFETRGPGGQDLRLSWFARDHVALLEIGVQDDRAYDVLVFPAGDDVGVVVEEITRAVQSLVRQRARASPLSSGARSDRLP